MGLGFGRMQSVVISAVTVVGLAWVPGASAATAGGCGPAWVNTWNASQAPWTGGNTPPIVPWNPGMANVPTLQTQVQDLTGRTLRMPLRMRVAGSTLRLHFSNRYGSAPLMLGPIEVAPVRRALDEPVGAKTDGAASHRVLFNGNATITIPAHEDATSDDVAMSVEDGQDVAVSVFIARSTLPVTEHLDARQTSYLSRRGDHTSDASGDAFVTPTLSWYFLGGIDVIAPRRVNAVATLGDSITDGTDTGLDEHKRWPDALQARLNATGGTRPMSVANAGLGGNSLTTSLPYGLIGGEPGVKRFAWDVAPLAGLTDVIVALGTNDLGFSMPPNYDANSLIAAHKQMAAMIRARGLRGFIATQLPANLPSHGNPFANAVRRTVNTWIREHGREHYDGVIDFAKVLADPADPDRLDPRYDGGDGVHPNNAGAMLLARAVDLDQLTGSPCLTVAAKRAPARLRVKRASIRSGHLSLRGTSAPGLNGTLRISARCPQRTRHTTAGVARGTWQARIRLPAGCTRRLQSVTVRFAGNTRYRPQTTTTRVTRNHALYR